MNFLMHTYIYLHQLGFFVCVDQDYRACLVIFMRYITLENLVILDIYREFDIILGMSLLSHYCAILDFYVDFHTTMLGIKILE